MIIPGVAVNQIKVVKVEIVDYSAFNCFHLMKKSILCIYFTYLAS